MAILQFFVNDEQGLRCIADCGSTPFQALIAFLVMSVVGFFLARWRPWTAALWIPMSWITMAVLFATGFGPDRDTYLALLGGVAVTGVGVYRGVPGIKFEVQQTLTSFI
jgi:hypothetical protein